MHGYATFFMHSFIDGHFHCFHFRAIMNDAICVFIQAYFVLLHLADTSFSETEGLCNSVSSKSFGIIFPTAFAHFVSLCHILVIITIISNCLLMFVMMICDL